VNWSALAILHQFRLGHYPWHHYCCMTTVIFGRRKSYLWSLLRFIASMVKRLTTGSALRKASHREENP
jgi:hypothetical protein